MTFLAFIEELEQKNPKLFAAERINITVDSFRAQLRRAYGAGYDQSHPPSSSHPSDPEALRSLFGIFGK